MLFTQPYACSANAYECIDPPTCDCHGKFKSTMAAAGMHICAAAAVDVAIGRWSCACAHAYVWRR